MAAPDFFSQPVEDPFAPLADDPAQLRGPASPKSGSRGTAHSRVKTAQDDVNAFCRHGDPEKRRRAKVEPQSRKHQVDHNDRCQKYWEALGFHCDRLDGWMKAGEFNFKRKDFQGIWDRIATKPGEPPVFIQICSKDDLGKHLRKMASRDEAPDNKRPRVENLRWMIACGFRCVFHVFDQPGGYRAEWTSEVVDITEDMIAAVESRRRK